MNSEIERLSQQLSALRTELDDLRAFIVDALNRKQSVQPVVIDNDAAHEYGMQGGLKCFAVNKAQAPTGA